MLWDNMVRLASFPDGNGSRKGTESGYPNTRQKASGWHRGSINCRGKLVWFCVEYGWLGKKVLYIFGCSMLFETLDGYLSPAVADSTKDSSLAVIFLRLMFLNNKFLSYSFSTCASCSKWGSRPSSTISAAFRLHFCSVLLLYTSSGRDFKSSASLLSFDWS